MTVFIHIPKTGGTTLNNVVEDAFGHKAWIFSHEGLLYERVNALQPGEVPDIHYLSGHLALSTVKIVLPRISGSVPVRYVTVLREPLNRTFSFYMFLNRVKTAIPHISMMIEGKDFEYFIDAMYDHGEWQLRDAQTWLLCGERSAARAIEVIENEFCLVGVTEHYNAFYRNFRTVINPGLPETLTNYLGKVAPRGQNLALGEKPENWGECVSARTRSRLEQMNAADFTLYQYMLTKHGGLFVGTDI